MKSGRILRPLRTCAAAALVILFALSSGCSGGNEGWGVVLWSQNEDLYPTGSIVQVAGISQLNETYDIRTDKRSAMESVSQWRIAYFRRKSKAEDFKAEYAEYAGLYAVAALDGLPVREERDPDAKRSYKLRGGEVAKVLTRDGEKSVVAGIEGYWFEILTEGGISGYSFDKYLEILTLEQLTGLSSAEERDEFLDQFLISTFRPKHYKRMLDTGRIDLQRFLPDYGIFPDPENRTIHIVAENHSSTLTYSSISRVTANTYAFEGSTLLVIVKNPYEVNLQYSDENGQYSEEYIRIDTDIDLLIIEETERRAAIFEGIYSRGNTLSSSAYGTITLIEGGGFVWEGYERLVPGVVSPAAGNSGSVDFRLHLGQGPAQQYDGVITFIFDGSDIVHFLYSMEDLGIRLKYLTCTPDNEKPLLVEEEGNSPIVIFFRFSTEEAS